MRRNEVPLGWLHVEASCAALLELMKYSWQRPGGVRASSSRPKLNLRESGRESISGGRTSSGSIAKELLYLSN